MSLQVWLPLNGSLINNGLNNIVTLNTPTFIDSIFGKGLSLSPRISYSNLQRLNKFTILFWVKVDSCSVDWADVIGFTSKQKDGTSASEFRFEATKTTRACSFHNNSPYAISTASRILITEQQKGTWHNVGVTYDGKTLCSYIDGEKVYTDTGLEGYLIDTFHIGETNNMVGVMNDLRIYDDVLSLEQIKEISRGLVLHYPLNSGYGNENLLVNSYNGCNVSYTSGTILDETYCGFKIRYLKYEGTSYQDTVPVLNVMAPKPDSYYTISFWAKGNCGISNFFFPSTCASGISSDGHTTTSVDGNCYINLTPEWKRYWITWKTRSDVSGTKNIVVGRIQNKGTGAECYIAGLKFEEGDKNSIWSPNQADDLYSQLGYDSTTVYDTSGFGNNAEKINTPIYTSDTPLYDSSIVFDGETQHLITNSDLTSIFNSGEFSISFWIKVKSINTSEASFILCCGDNNKTNKMLHIAIRNTGQFAFCFYDNDYDTSYNFSSHLNEWIFITCTYKDLIQKVYVNGELYGNNTSSNNLSIPNSSKLFIGKRSNRETYANVDLSNLKVYSTALSAEDIKQLYQTKAKVDKNGNLYCNQFIDNDYEEELLTTQKMTFHQANSQGTITYETNGNEVINIITMDNTISSWKYLFNNAFDKTKIINHKLKLSFKYKTNVSTAYSMAVKMCKGDLTKPQTINIGSITLSTNWQEYNGIITFGNTYDNQGIYIHTGNFCGGNLYIKDLSLKIYENNNKTDFTKKSQIITGELSELDSNKTYVYKNSKIVTNQIIEN